jgi:hypothetical protein
LTSRQRELRSALALSVVPVGVSLLTGMLLMPGGWVRAPIPDVLPLPVIDSGALRKTADEDRDRAARAVQAPLPGVTRKLGSALRDLHALEIKNGSPNDLDGAREAVDAAFIDAQSAGVDALAGLRAVQLEAFLHEVRHFESTGEESAELSALAGGFVRSMRSEGWCDGRRLTPNEPQLRALFKQMWNNVLGIGAPSPLALSLDEERELFALRLSHPHLPPNVRDSITIARRDAKNERVCAAIAQTERKAFETWSIVHIDRLAAVDPAYPAEYARGIAHLQAGDPSAAASAFRDWLGVHPDGPFTVRARAYLRSVSNALRVE